MYCNLIWYNLWYTYQCGLHADHTMIQTLKGSNSCTTPDFLPILTYSHDTVHATLHQRLGHHQCCWTWGTVVVDIKYRDTSETQFIDCSLATGGLSVTVAGNHWLNFTVWNTSITECIGAWMIEQCDSNYSNVKTNGKL